MDLHARRVNRGREREGDAMAPIDFSKLPKFSQLPVKPGAPKESSWGVFGDSDELGCLNLLTPEGVVEAAKLVQKGRVFRLDTPINYARPPLFNRTPAKHTILSFERFGLLGHDDSIDNYNTQEGSQWDGLAHIGHVRHRAFYNGVKPDQIKDGPDGKLSIHRWANRFVGRGLLIDVWKYVNDQRRPINPLTSAKYPLADLKDALKAQGATLKPGSILLIRTGWMQAYLKATADEKAKMAPLEGLKSCGIEDSSATVEWFWDNRVAAVGTDCPAVEPWPWDFRNEGALHYRTLSLLGLPIGEQFVLDDLAADCAADKRYEFMLVSVPMNLEGGIASPPNAVAIK
jgi:kynurenine formamidase